MVKLRFLEKLYKHYSGLLYHLPDNRIPLPKVIIWTITYKCNLRCSFCSYYGKYGTPRDLTNDLSFDEIKEVIEDIKRSYKYYPYKPFFGILGGEPFIRPDFFDVLELLKENRFKFAITTNMSMLDNEKIKRLIELKPLQINVSLDGPREVHDKIRGMKGVFDKAVEAIRTISSDNNGKKIPIKLNCVMCPENIDYLEEMIKLAHELNVDLSLQHLTIYDDRIVENNRKVTAGLFGVPLPCPGSKETLNDKEIVKLLAKYDELKELAKRLNVNLKFIPEIKKEDVGKYYKDMNFLYSNKCTYTLGVIRLRNNGDLSPCMGYIVGNLRKDRFKEVINNEQSVKFRKNLKKVKLFPGCVRCCKL